MKSKEGEKEATPPAASTASSAFSFMMGSTEAPPSAFSFLSTSAVPETKPEPEPAVSSAFSFMGSMGAASTEKGASSFDFMAASTVHDLAPALQVPEPPPIHDSSANAPSVFSFVPQPEPPSTTPSYNAPAVGAGVTFGGAAATKVVKRRTRGVKVGGARAGDLPAIHTDMTPVPPPETSPVVHMRKHYHAAEEPESPPPAPNHSHNTADLAKSSAKLEAEEAAQRAEQFMASMQQQSTIAGGMNSPGSSFAPPVDVELETAKKAAEAAHARLTKEKEKTSAFKWFGGGRTWGSGSSHGKQSPSDTELDDRVDDMAKELGGGVVAAAGSSELAINKLASDGESSIERILKEQEEIKRAMAQRHAVMQEQEESRGFVPVMTRSIQPPIAVFKFEQPMTPTEELDQLFKNFSSQVKKAMDGVGRLRQQRNMLLDERYVALAKERLAIQQIKQAEAQQLLAAESDDFDSAERLQIIIDKHHRDKGELTAILENIGRALAQLDSQTPNVVGAVSACFEGVEQQLRNFFTKLSSADKEVGAEAQKRFQATAAHLSGEDERIKQELKQIERDEELANEERKDLDSAILEQTAAMEDSKGEAIKKLEYVQQEIIFLRKQLAEKESEVVRLQNEVGYQEQGISKVRVQFTRQLQRVQKKETAAEQNRREWLTDKASYERLRDAHEAEVKSHSENLLIHTNMMDLLKREFTLAGTFREIVSNEIGFDNNRNEAKEADGEMAGLQAEVVKCEAAVAEAKQFVKVADAALISLSYELETLQSRLPQLEAVKKDAATTRDFKTAGQASKEIKEATLRLEACQKELNGEAQDRMKAAQIKLEQLTKELVAVKAIADEKEKESGKEIMEKIANKIRKLVDTKKKVCGNDEGNSIKGMGSFVLMAQIHALKIEGQHFGSKFGGWDEIMATIDESDHHPESPQNNQPSSHSPQNDEPSPRPSDAVDPELVAKGREINQKIKDAEEALEAAVAREDYDEASELDELFKQIQLELEGLGLTDAEAELVLSGGEVSSPDVSEQTIEETKQDITSNAPEADEVVEEIVNNVAANDDFRKGDETLENVTNEESDQGDTLNTDEKGVEAATEKVMETVEEGEMLADKNGKAGDEGECAMDTECDEFHDTLALGEESENRIQ